MAQTVQLHGVTGAQSAADSSAAPDRSWADIVWRLTPALVPGLAMLILGRWRIGDPSLGRDELATLAVARRSVGQIFQLAGHIDGAITPYYLFMHVWTGVFGTSALALRAPSLIAIAIGVGLVGELGRKLFNPMVGLIGGLLLTLVPQMSRYAQEARVYGITFLFITLSTLLLYRAIERPTWGRWLWYGGTVLLVGLAQMIGLTMLVGHGFAALNRWRRGQNRDLLRWVPVAGIAVLAVAPLVVLGLGQRGLQLDWIAKATITTVRNAPADLFLNTALAWLLIGMAVFARWDDRWLVGELALMALVPPAALLAESFLSNPLWVPRYVLFTLAPIALLAAAGVYRYRGRTLVLLVVAAVLAWPSQQTVRSAAEHQGPNVRYLTSLIVKEQTGGDGIIYTGANAWSMRVGVDYYLAGRSGPRDLLLQRPAAELGELADQQCSDAAACIGQTPRIWLVVQNPAGKPTPAQLILDRDYRKVQTWTVSKGSLTLYERG